MARRTGGPADRSIRPARIAIAIAIALALLPSPLPVAQGGAPQDPYAHNVAAPVLELAGSSDGGNVVVLDEEGRYTFLFEAGELERSWIPPTRGHLSEVDPLIGGLAAGISETTPRPIGVSMTPDGEYWAGAAAYSQDFGGRVHGFAHWSDEPIWTFQLDDGEWGSDAVQPTSIASGGNYHAVGTDDGKVYVLRAGGQDGSDKKAHRTYKQSNEGEPFGPINDIAVSRDGDLFLIGTNDSDKRSLHLYTDVFFKATFNRVTDPVERVALSADGTRGAAVTGSGDRSRVHFLDTDGGLTIWEHTVASDVNGISLSEDGSLLAVGLANGRVHLYEERGDILDSEPRRVFNFDSTVTSVAAADDGFAAVATTENGRLHMLDLRRSKPLWSFTVPAPAVSATISGDQELISVGSKSGDEGRVTYLSAKHHIEHFLPPSPRLLPGQAQTIPVELANNGNRMATIEVQWRNTPEHWEPQSTNLTLAPGETGTLGAKLTLPPGQGEGDYELGFDLVNGALRIPVDIKVRVPEVTSGQSVQLWTFERAVPGGAPAAYLLKLLNTGNTLNELALGYSGLPTGWDAEFTGARETKLRPGEDRQVSLTVRAPPEAKEGDEVWFDLVIAWQHGEERHPLRVEVVDHKTYTFHLNKSLGDYENGDLPGGDNLDSLLKYMSHENDNPIVLTEGGDSVLIPFGGPLVPLAAIGALLAVVLRARRKTDA